MCRELRRAVMVAVLAVGGFASANGIIIPPPGPIPPPPPGRPRPAHWRDVALEVRRATLQVRIEAGNATTEVDQVFRNPHDRQIEGTFLFPLPEGAAVSQFSMYVNGEELKGELLTKEEANKIYEDIVRRMQDPAILEYAGRSLFRARIFPIPAKADVRVAFSYSHRLSYDAGLFSYRYPMSTNKHSPTPLDSLAVSVRIESDRPIKGVYSPTHEIDVHRPDDHTATAGFEATGARPEEDFILYHTVSEQPIGVKALSYREGGEDGFFLALVAPEVEERDRPAVAKDVAFVFDTSGSMSVHDKMSQARNALEFCLKALHERDRFAVIDFSTTVRAFQPELLPATAANIQPALEYVRGLQARGATNIEEALATALKMGRGGDRPYYVVFMTDGLPTIGERDPVRLSEQARELADERARLFTFGVGYDVNVALLDRLAAENRGAPAYVTPEEDLEHAVSSFYTKISSPVLSDVTIEFGGSGAYDLFPRRLPDIFRGSQIEIAGRYRAPGPVAVTVKGNVDGEERVFTYEDTFAESSRDHESLPRLWAVRKVGYLLDESRLHGMSDELREEIVRLSRKYGILTPYTAYLVTEDETRPMPAAERRVFEDAARATVPAPRRERMARDLAGARVQTGKEAVDMSRDFQAFQEGRVARLAEPGAQRAAQRVQNIGQRAYYFDDSRWVVAEYEEGQETRKVQYLSEEYFRLIRSDIRLARAFAQGPRVIAEVDGVFYEVVEE